MKDKCTGCKSDRHIFRSFHQEFIDKVKAYHQTESYKKASRKRSLWVEPLFGEAKDFHRLRRFRLRGLQKVNIEGYDNRRGQNLKRLIKHQLERLFLFLRRLIFQSIPERIVTFSTACKDIRIPLGQLGFFSYQAEGYIIKLNPTPNINHTRINPIKTYPRIAQILLRWVILVCSVSAKWMACFTAISMSL